MKMFKKIMAVALVGVMALSMLAGCAVTDAVKERQLRRAWRWQLELSLVRTLSSLRSTRLNTRTQ